MGDRFYGNGEVIEWCQDACWDYSLRLKGSMFLSQKKDVPRAQLRKLNQLWAEEKHQFEEAYLRSRCLICHLLYLRMLRKLVIVQCSYARALAIKHD